MAPILTLLAKKFLPGAVLLSVGLVSGIGLQQKVFAPKPVAPVNCAPCPACNCPAVTVQPFEVTKMKNLKTFTYSPGFNGSISVAGVDSTSVKKYIEDAVMRAFDQHVKTIEPAKRKRR